MNENNSGRNAGLSLGTLLTVLFVALKLTNQIDWAWVWVFSPLWISAAIMLVMIVILGLVFAWLGR